MTWRQQPWGDHWTLPRGAAGDSAGRVDLIVGDCREYIETLTPGSVSACVTSPPYWRQRNYTALDQRHLELGQEQTPEEWVASLVAVFGAVRRVLKPDGCLWLNVGDKFAAGGLGGGGMASRRANWRGTMGEVGWRKPPAGYKPKDLTLAPLELARALRDDGWVLRQTVIWAKANAVEPPRLDRPSTAHEYVFLLAVSQNSRVRDPGEPWWHSSVWTISNDGDGSHVAQMPIELARRCIVTATQPGDVVLDPFAGSSTTLLAASRLNRDSIGIELDPQSAELSRTRIAETPLFSAPSPNGHVAAEPLELFA